MNYRLDNDCVKVTFPDVAKSTVVLERWPCSQRKAKALVMSATYHQTIQKQINKVCVCARKNIYHLSFSLPSIIFIYVHKSVFYIYGHAYYIYLYVYIICTYISVNKCDFIYMWNFCYTYICV